MYYELLDINGSKLVGISQPCLRGLSKKYVKNGSSNQRRYNGGELSDGEDVSIPTKVDLDMAVTLRYHIRLSDNHKRLIPLLNLLFPSIIEAYSVNEDYIDVDLRGLKFDIVINFLRAVNKVGSTHLDSFLPITEHSDPFVSDWLKILLIGSRGYYSYDTSDKSFHRTTYYTDSALFNMFELTSECMFRLMLGVKSSEPKHVVGETELLYGNLTKNFYSFPVGSETDRWSGSDNTGMTMDCLVEKIMGCKQRMIESSSGFLKKKGLVTDPTFRALRSVVGRDVDVIPNREGTWGGGVGRSVLLSDIVYKRPDGSTVSGALATSRDSVHTIFGYTLSEAINADIAHDSSCVHAFWLDGVYISSVMATLLERNNTTGAITAPTTPAHNHNWNWDLAS